MKKVLCVILFLSVFALPSNAQCSRGYRNISFGFNPFGGYVNNLSTSFGRSYWSPYNYVPWNYYSGNCYRKNWNYYNHGYRPYYNRMPCRRY